MHIVFVIAWILWIFALVGLFARLIARSIAQAKALKSITTTANRELNLHELRVLSNRGDWRDPIERHQDSLTVMTDAAGLAVAALALTFIQFIAT
ncbi:hypothetical protein LJR129_005067 [Acidovorax sp. LjRoot129]|uniref:hypothetical protein n=1 Tax=unclassified Acidovorax TaxID=2684926 RepID=UPI003ECE33A4